VAKKQKILKRWRLNLNGRKVEVGYISQVVFVTTKDNDGIFHLTLSLLRGFPQYKFKVDENWIYNKIHSKNEDNGNVNNFIDTIDYNNLNEYEKNYENEKEIELFDKNIDDKKNPKNIMKK